MSGNKGKVLILVLALVATIVLVVLFTKGTFAPLSNRESIEQLVTQLVDDYNDEDWESFTAQMHSSTPRQKLIDTYSGWEVYPALQSPPTIVDLQIEGEKASALVEVTGRLLGQNWTRRGQMKFIKIDDDWFLDADNSFDGFPRP